MTDRGRHGNCQAGSGVIETCPPIAKLAASKRSDRFVSAPAFDVQFSL